MIEWKDDYLDSWEFFVNIVKYGCILFFGMVVEWCLKGLFCYILNCIVYFKVFILIVIGVLFL